MANLICILRPQTLCGSTISLLHQPSSSFVEFYMMNWKKASLIAHQIQSYLLLKLSVSSYRNTSHPINHSGESTQRSLFHKSIVPQEGEQSLPMVRIDIRFHLFLTNSLLWQLLPAAGKCLCCYCLSFNLIPFICKSDDNTNCHPNSVSDSGTNFHFFF